MTLTEYYANLPEPTSPKTEFLLKLARICKVRETTVRNWVKGRNIPTDPKMREAISALTDIPVSELFPPKEM